MTKEEANHFLEGPYRFRLRRDEDATGVSGTGVIAHGIMFGDGVCALRWRTEFKSTTVYDNHETLMAIHGHEGKTVCEWIDERPSPLHRRAVLNCYQDRCEGCEPIKDAPLWIPEEDKFEYMRAYRIAQIVYFEGW